MAAIIARVQSRTWDHYPMLIMTDEEGGGVQRLTNVIGSIPWAKTMGKNLTASQITGIGTRIGSSMLAAGVTTDLAPVLDVDASTVEPGALNPDGLRSFSGLPAAVALDGVAFMDGLSSAHVTAIVKHFPGLGGSSRNTDYGPATTQAWSVLEKTALAPFESAIASGAPGVMLANASVPGLTSIPASLSATVVQVLRHQLGFRGLIMTDSLSAGAISALGLSVANAAVKALVAGANIVLYGSPGSAASSLAIAHQISDAVVSAVLSVVLTRSVLIGDAAHILTMRNTFSC